MIMGAVVAVLLYWVFFGTVTLTDSKTTVGEEKAGDVNSSNLPFKQHWYGALMYASRAIETPISAYYFENCYLPTIYNNFYIDKELGVLDDSKITIYDNMKSVNNDLSGIDTDSFTEDAPSESSYDDRYIYNTGFK